MTAQADSTGPATRPDKARHHVRHAPLQRFFAEAKPGYRLVAVRPMGPDDTRKAGDDTLKAVGYGEPLLITLRGPDDERELLVLHTVSANSFGHDRRADRAAAVLLAYDGTKKIPLHVPAVHLGAFKRSGELVALDDAEELFWVTRYQEGKLYADELRELARRGACSSGDVQRAEALGSYLAALHQPVDDAPAYVRSIRDLLGAGEGIFGIADDYRPTVGGAPPKRIQDIEMACLQERWKLRKKPERLVRSHGDFHPFNILFNHDSELVLLDASRGCLGDAADDLTALAINYLFFALQHPGSWRCSFQPLWLAFFGSYFARRPDPGALIAAPAFFAWRTLVLCSPRWYPDLKRNAREALLEVAENALASGRLDIEEIAKLPL